MVAKPVPVLASREREQTKWHWVRSIACSAGTCQQKKKVSIGRSWARYGMLFLPHPGHRHARSWRFGGCGSRYT